MKTIFYAALLTVGLTATAQSNTNTEKENRKTITVLNIDAKGVGLDPSQAGNLVRLELEKLNLFDVMDRYDVSYMIDKNQLNIANCYGKLCLVEMGKTVKSEKMFTGSVELYTETIVITLRQIDVASATIEKTQVKEFLNLPKELQSMISIAIREMYGLKNDEATLIRLTKKFNYENLTNNPTEERLNLSGPRMGFIAFTQSGASRLRESSKTGGYDAFPMMFQFGYQFEKQYLNEGNFQALFEFVPLITGLDQGLIIPSFTVMNGLRNNKNGWEFAFGPTVSLVTKAEGYYDENGKWRLAEEWVSPDPINPVANPYPLEMREDSRGKVAFSTGFVFAFGKTFKSGKLNIPVNAFIIPASNGIRFGASFGFNAKK